MLVFSNRRLGPAAELLVSHEAASALLFAVANAARRRAFGHWEHELVRWLEERSAQISSTIGPDHAIDVSDIAFTPQHFEHQRRFLVKAIEHARMESEHSRALAAWADLIEAHPSDSVQFGRRWTWHSSI